MALPMTKETGLCTPMTRPYPTSQSVRSHTSNPHERQDICLLLLPAPAAAKIGSTKGKPE
eukprot:scaffold49194_cov18-Tisochrysis_lutea.AAC.2